MQLPFFQSSDRVLQQLQTQWRALLNPVLANPLTNAQMLQNVVLKNGVTVINHKLGQIQQGWLILDINGSSNVYRSAPFNDLTLTLTSSATVTVNLLVF
jgi:hypothetical protein